MPKKIKYQTGSFGALLSELICNKAMTKTKFHQTLGVSKTYLFDVLNSRVPPPCPEMQFKIIKILEPPENQRIEFFELAAEKRSETPADIAQFLKEKTRRNELRKKINYRKLTEIGEKRNEIK